MHARMFLLVSVAAVALLPGCNDIDYLLHENYRPTKTGEQSEVNEAMQSVIDKAAAQQGIDLRALRMLERAYRENPGPETATAYARALRKSGYANRAAIILGPFAVEAEASTELRTEYAAVQLELGRWAAAEETAASAVRDDPDSPKAARAYHLLGVALEAQGRHAEAERAFRRALSLWEGDPAPVENNLALNLAAQGKLEEAERILLKARADNPNRPDIARNLRMIESLRMSVGKRS